ncbi:MAG: hypothetical protein PW845_29335 [Pseudomonas sp.]|uniref:hypothetical protein n=1 Tax=Pseudomonas abieticivorans TaxID=2931382 RepID=UPI0020BF0FED|nr:hypothetical protein [Pseudomonas sp. PIA16]MDE1169370.1 hypothetical protein [Pseudomonas sp.]
MKRVLGMGVLVAVALAGCTGQKMDSTRTAGPAKTFDSQKPAQKVAQCIEFYWKDEAVFGATTDAFVKNLKDGSFTVYTTDSEYFADVRPVGAGAQARYYVMAPDKLADRRLAAVASCL